jgi:multisubunit Na+/H+ antiporter MnhB subunit
VTLGMAFDAGLAALLVAVAVWTIVARDSVTAVITFVVYGLLLSLAWVRLAAVDVALTEAAIGGGVTGMLLLGAATHSRQSEVGTTFPFAAMLAAGLACTLISIGLAATVLLLPDPAATLAPAAVANLAETGLGNPVTGVLFVYRALDTLLEKVVLVLALVGVWSLAADGFWGGIAVPRLYAHASMLSYLAQLLPPVGLIIGIYMFWTGADHPGGAFQGGAILAAMWLVLMIARLQDLPATSRPWLRLLLVIGPIIFTAIGLAGLAFADAFLAYPQGYAKPLIIIAEAGLTLSIGVTLALLVAGTPARMQQP